MHDIVQDYYGRQLQHSAELKTSACCDISQVPAWLKPLLARIHPEVLSRYYGCGLVCPPLLEGGRVLDLGCGSGRDVYALAQLVGPTGEVVGVDMTEEQSARFPVSARAPIPCIGARCATSCRSSPTMARCKRDTSLP